MFMRDNMYLTKEKMLDVITSILDHENIPYKIIEDPGVIMKFKRGCHLWQLESTHVPTMCTIITNFYEAIKFIDTHGLRQI